MSCILTMAHLQVQWLGDTKVQQRLSVCRLLVNLNFNRCCLGDIKIAAIDAAQRISR